MNMIMASILNLAGPDMLVILFCVLLMFGAKKLPELARGMGRAVSEFTSTRGLQKRSLASRFQAIPLAPSAIRLALNV